MQVISRYWEFIAKTGVRGHPGEAEQTWGYSGQVCAELACRKERLWENVLQRSTLHQLF